MNKIINNPKVYPILFYAGILLVLLQVWVPGYFLTGDGPCHLYNAKVLSQFWANEYVSFYDRFYIVNDNPDPNWFGHIVLAGLLYVFNGAVAEKIFITLYILLLVRGFVRLLAKFNKDHSKFYSLAVFLFIFHTPLFKGFYNFSFSIGFFIWLTWAWLNYLDKRSVGAALFCILLAPFSFFSHPLGFCYAALLSACLWLAGIIKEKIDGGMTAKVLAGGVVVYLLTFLPWLILLKSFMGGGAWEIELKADKERLTSFSEFRFLLNHTSSEQLFIKIAAGILLISFLIAVVVRIVSRKKFARNDGLWPALVVSFFLYYMMPDWLLGGGMLVMRTQLLTYILLFFCIASVPMGAAMSKYSSLLLFGSFIALSIVRFPVLLKGADGVADYLSCKKYIKAKSVLLPLSFSHNGRDRKGDMIHDANWLFPHAAQYLGSDDKPLIMLDNYEANTGYFPLIWKPEVNP